MAGLPTRTVELGHLGRRARTGSVGDLRGCLFYLPDVEAVVVPQLRLAGGWRCVVVARRHLRHAAPFHGHLHVTDADLSRPTTAVTVGRVGDADGYAMLWQVRVVQRWPGGRMPILARLVATPPIRVGRAVHLPERTVQRLVHAVHARPVGLRGLLDRLVKAGLLIPMLPDIDGGWGTYALTIPDEHTEPPLSGKVGESAP